MAFTAENFDPANGAHFHFWACFMPDMEQYAFVIAPKFLTQHMDDADRAHQLIGQEWVSEAEGVFHYQNGASANSALAGYDVLIRLGMEDSPQYAAAVSEDNGRLTREQLAEAARIELEGLGGEE